ncbi:MAG: aldehyde dehydrogenase family protein, partial [Candidatus Omnitrophota bacterium]
MNVTTIQQFDLLVEGKISPPLSGKYFDCINPSNGEVFARLADAGDIDVDVAIQSARLSFDHGRWSKMPLSERGVFLTKIGQTIRQNAKELADLECACTGKTIKHATFIDVPTAAETFEYFGSLKELPSETIKVSSPNLSVVEREPVGVVVANISWNYPLIMAAWKIAPILMAGNTAILRPSATAAASVMALAKIIAQVGLPKGVLNIISSFSTNVGRQLVASAQVDMVSFTGSTKSGQEVMGAAAKNVKKLVLELGGKSPNIVFADCDMDAAIGGTLSAIFMNQGQMCTAGSRLLVEDKIYKEFTEKLVSRAKTLKIGPADSFETEFGPLASVAHRDSVLKFIKIGINEKAKLACGGKIPEGLNPKGAYLEPTIFVDVRNDMTIAQEEIFGPVLCVIPFTNVEQAVHIANDSKYGLAAMIW